MKRRLTRIAALFLLADALAAGAAWHVGPPLSLAAALAVPAVEPMLAPLYTEPLEQTVTIDVAGGALRAALYRPAQPHRSLVLLRDDARADGEVATLARTVARRGVLVLVPVPGSEDPSLVGGYAKSFRVPVDVATVSAFDRERRAESPRTRAEYAWRLYRWSAALLSAR